MISILILTKDEEKDLPGCLESIAYSDDICVFDSYSTDKTVEIAYAAGAKVVQRAFDNYAAQRNAALHTVSWKHPWVLILDADERVPEPLAREIEQFVSNPPSDVVAAQLQRRDFFMGRWLKHAQITPFYIRLVRPESVHYEREINEVLKANGKVVSLKEPFDHFPFSKGIAHWIHKHNQYSSMEADRLIKERDENMAFSAKKALFGSSISERRVHQKGLFYQLPGRPFIKLLYILVWRRAFMDGAAGVTYSVLQSIYEYFIVLKTRERRKFDLP